MAVYTLNPLEDHRWPEFVDANAAASVFHTREWVAALHRTYGYEPVVYTTSAPGTRLVNGILLCRISSWITGRRMVSLPFTDHCEPLVDCAGDRTELVTALRAARSGQKLQYVEIRSQHPDRWNSEGMESAGSYAFHTINLRRPLATLFGNAHRSTIQRKIQRAERERIAYEPGPPERLLPEFYRLQLMTRRRHGIPAQPLQWFENLLTCLGDRVLIGVARWRGRAIGGMLTLRHGDTLTYKYGCSDSAHHHLGTMPFLFWRAIEQAKAAGLCGFDLGRSDRSNAGLIRFKERLGADASTLTYVRERSPSSPARAHRRRLPRRIPGWLLASMPDVLFTATGRLLYRHLG